MFFFPLVLQGPKDLGPPRSFGPYGPCDSEGKLKQHTKIPRAKARGVWVNRIQNRVYRRLNLLSNFKISTYNHTIVTNNPNPAYHSINLGASPPEDMSEINWKSSIRLSAASIHTPTLIPIDNGEEEVK